MILIEVKKVMAAMIGGFEVIAKKCIGCDEDYATQAFLCVGCLVTCSSDLDKMGWHHLRTAFLVVLIEYRVMISRVKAQGLALIGCTWQWPC
jgi:hypothetical protein